MAGVYRNLQIDLHSVNVGIIITKLLGWSPETVSIGQVTLMPPIGQSLAPLPVGRTSCATTTSGRRAAQGHDGRTGGVVVMGVSINGESMEF